MRHVVFDEDTCMRVELGGGLALAVLEALFLGIPQAPEDETYRGESVLGLFRTPPHEASGELAVTAEKSGGDDVESRKDAGEEEEEEDEEDEEESEEEKDDIGKPPC